MAKTSGDERGDRARSQENERDILFRAGKKPINRKTHSQNFTGLSRDYPGTAPGLSRPFPQISWEFCLCVSLFPQEKGKHINNLTSTHFRDNPAKLFILVFLPPDYWQKGSISDLLWMVALFCMRVKKHTSKRGKGVLEMVMKPCRLYLIKRPLRGSKAQVSRLSAI